MSTRSINRRDFLKLISMGAVGQLLPKVVSSPMLQGNPNSLPNVLILVFDAWAANNISFYGYDRDTMPHLSRLLERAIVYHNHYATSNFTTPGTASILTGKYSWSHKATHSAEVIDPATSDENIFHSLKDDYFQFAYTHNSWADSLIKQQRKDLDQYIYRSEFCLDDDLIFDRLLNNDFDVANAAKTIGFFDYIHVFQSSLILQRIHLALRKKHLDYWEAKFPRGLPRMGNSEIRFVLEDGIDWLAENLKKQDSPYLGYFHFLPPHDPYNTRIEFADRFLEDGYQPIVKPNHRLSKGYSQESLDEHRRLYDEFLLYVDAEIGRLFQQLESQGVLDNLWIFLTSDHGEHFERGDLFHTSKTLYRPVVHVPLIIFSPDQEQRLDIHSPTSATDLLPTILQLAGKDIPPWCEGVPLPMGKTRENFDRQVYALQALYNLRKGPLNTATLMMVKGQYKAMKSVGYPELNGDDLREVYDLAADPEELDDLILSQPKLANEIARILDNKFEEIKQIYESK